MIEDFLPKNSAIQPKNIVPNNPPKHGNELNHDASSIEIGPDFSGESSDCSRVKVGDDQPIATPYTNVVRLAVEEGESERGVRRNGIFISYHTVSSV